MAGPAGGTVGTEVLADLIPGALVRDLVLIGAHALAIAVAAQVAFRLPFTPVPVTGQTFAVLLGAMVLGSWRGSAGASLYLLLGLAGLPWFSWAGGFASLGYIVGFVLAAALVGWLAERGLDRRPLPAAGAMAAGNVVIYAVGVPFLAWVTGMGAGEALVAGALWFVPGDVAKIALATALVPATWAIVGRRPAGGGGPHGG